jgi:putative DNA primase/helicase
MREDFVEFTPSHLAILVTNHLPKVPGDDPAIWRRLRVIPFDVVIPDDKQDKELDTKLALEADGILSWAVAGWTDYLKHGLAEPDSVLKATATYKTNSDAVARFIEEGCHQAAAAQITASELFDAWECWRKIDGADEISKKTLGQALNRLGFTSRDSNGKRWWQGICVLKGGKQ